MHESAMICPSGFNLSMEDRLQAHPVQQTTHHELLWRYHHHPYLHPRSLMFQICGHHNLSMKRMNLDYTRDIQLWRKIWPHSAFKVIRAENKTAQETVK